MKVTQCSSRNFTENLPTWELRAQTKLCAIFKAHTACTGAPSESITFFPRPHSPRSWQTASVLPLNKCPGRHFCVLISTLAWEERLVHSQCWCESPWERGRNIPVQSHCRREVSDGSLRAEQGAALHQACEELAVCAHPPTDLVKNNCAVHSHIDSQRGNSPYLGKYCLLILDILSEFRQTCDLEYGNTMKPKLHVQLASLYPRNIIMVRKAGIFVQLHHFIKEKPKHWTCMWLWYIQGIWLLVLCIYTKRKLQEWAKCDNCIEAEGFCM